jgi:hypothetical protein
MDIANYRIKLQKIKPHIKIINNYEIVFVIILWIKTSFTRGQDGGQ